MNRSRFLMWGVLALLISMSIWACDVEDKFLTGDSVNIRLELDTLRFDTVFTELGSATQSIKIYNEGDDAIQLDRVFIEGTTGVDFNMNVDGIPGDEVEDVIIWGKDSIYVFVEVTIDPDQPTSVSPFVVEDYLVVETGSKQSRALLEAWGQNANYFPSRYNSGELVALSCNNSTITWDSDLPYVVYGVIFIEECILEIAAGTQIYMHGGIAQDTSIGIFNDGMFITLSAGSIQANGTAENPVVFQGDRLEEGFQDQGGQWNGIILGTESANNVFNHTVIKNSIFGIRVDSLADVTLSNSQIHTTTSSAIFANRASVTANNCLFYDNASNALQIVQGGFYEFNHCTIANYGVDASAVALSNFRCYDSFCEVFSIFPLDAQFKNCILFGSRRDELIISDAADRTDPSLYNLAMENCVLKTDELLTRTSGLYADFFETICIGCVDGEREDALFLDRNEDDYHLDTLSIAKDIGLVIPGFEVDLEGMARDAMPDAGCFERIE